MTSARRSSPPGAMPSRVGSRYDVLDQLGRGGTSVVYRVRDRSHGTELALKRLVLPASAIDREARALFEREFQVLSQLHHPSAVAVHDYGVDGLGPYYTMELLGGGDLHSRAPWPFRDACEAMMQVCSLLSLLHARGFVHRDITPRNVRFAPNGAAKLIDFGAMAPMGPCTQAVGTPGFVAPEVVHHLRLDARTDLFSVGATLYHAVSGERPFPARTLAELAQHWRRVPPPLSQLAPDVPHALDALVAALLQVDPARRPNSAFEVMQRLAALSGRPLADSAEVARAYLSAPLIAGRDAQQRTFRQVLRRAEHGAGAGLYVHGASGSGRSRLLGAFALEAKTAGAIVLRADGRAVLPAPFSCAQLLAAQLIEALPDDAGPEREPDTHAALLAWLTRIGRTQLLVIAVDDAERIDSASLALLSALISQAPELRLLVICTGPGPQDAAAQRVAVLTAYSTQLAVTPLTAADTKAVFGSVFGSVPHVPLVSDRIHKLSAGNPRTAMTLAQHMLDQQLIRYADGAWALPAELAVSDLPASSEDALRQALAQLPQPSRRLAQAQALALEAPWTRRDYAELLGAAPDANDDVDDALAVLLRQGVVVEQSGLYTLAHLGVRSGLVQQLSAADRLELHLLLARWCEHTGRHGFVQAHHLLWGGDWVRGLDGLSHELESNLSVVESNAHLGLDAKTMALTLEHAYELATHAGRTTLELCEIARRILRLSVLTGEGLYERYAPALLSQLERDSGLADYRECGAIEPALARAAERYENTLPAARGYAPTDAIRYLMQLLSIANVEGARSRNAALLASLPARLEPFAQRSVAAHAMWHNLVGANEAMRGKLEQARERLLGVYDDLRGLTEADLPSVQYIPYGVAHRIANIEVFLGHESAETWIEILESDPLQRVNAQYMRRALCVFDGDLEGAERYRKRAELFATQSNTRQMYESSALTELVLQLHLGDLAGVKHAADRIGQLAARWPGFEPIEAAAHGHFQLLRGDVPLARSTFEHALTLSDPAGEAGPTAIDAWTLAAEGCMNALSELGELEAAQKLGLSVCERAEALEVSVYPRHILALARVETKLGRISEAAARLDTLLALHADRRRWLRAEYSEVRARVAIVAGDAEAATRYVQLTLQLGAARGSSAQIARRRQLIDEARQLDLPIDRPGQSGRPPRGASIKLNISAAIRRQVDGVLDRAASSEMRASKALELLRRALNASGGQLYFARTLGLVRVATDATSPEAALDRFASGHWRHRRTQAAMTTIITAADQPSYALTPGSWTSPSGTHYLLIPLSSGTEAESLGLVALAARAQPIPQHYWELSAAISVRLLELADLTRPSH